MPLRSGQSLLENLRTGSQQALLSLLLTFIALGKLLSVCVNYRGVHLSGKC